MYTQDELSDIIQNGIDHIKYPDLAPRLYDPVRYTMESGGKRLRPLLVLMATNLFKEDITPAIQPALGIEMYHNFTLLHDDVMDKAPERRGRATVHVKWDDNTAILSGDAMQALAYQLIAETPSYCLKEVIDVFNTTNIEIDEGQQLDLEFESRNDVRTEEYIEMIRLKTSVLLGCALKVGALVGQATPTQVQALYDFGINLGLAFQLQDDWIVGATHSPSANASVEISCATRRPSSAFRQRRLPRSLLPTATTSRNTSTHSNNITSRQAPNRHVAMPLPSMARKPRIASSS